MAETSIIAEPGKQEIIITREFDAPRDLVFRACTDPDLIAQWWGPERITTTVERLEMRPGGMWRIVQRDAGGNEYAFHGVYHDVTPPERIVDTVEFEGVPGHVLLETETFEDLGDGRTRMTNRQVFQTVEDRDGMLGSDDTMKEGMIQTMDQLARVVENLKAQRQAAPAR